jgi:hypothetical protein
MASVVEPVGKVFLNSPKRRRQRGRRRQISNGTIPNPWRLKCSGSARRWTWKRSGRCWTFSETAPTCDNLMWLPRARQLHFKTHKNKLFTAPARRAPVCAGPLVRRQRRARPFLDRGLFTSANLKTLLLGIRATSHATPAWDCWRFFTDCGRFLHSSPQHTYCTILTHTLFALSAAHQQQAAAEKRA